MKRKIDCLLIGHNEIDYAEREKRARFMGRKSAIYKDLALNFIKYDGRACSLLDIYNKFSGETRPIGIGSIFNPTIAYLGTYLHRRGLTFQYVNSFNDDQESLVEMLKESDFTAIAILTTLYLTPAPVIEIINFIKQYNITSKIIIGGPLISMQFKSLDEMSFTKMLESIGADFYINNSQGEATLVKLIKALKGNAVDEGLANIIYRDSGKFIANQIIPEGNLLEDNMVDWGLFADGLTEFVSLRTTISCPYNCSFCSLRLTPGNFRQ